MKKAIIIGVVCVLALVAAFAVQKSMRVRDSENPSNELTDGENNLRPTIEVLALDVFAVEDGGDRALADGEELTPPVTIKVSEGGFANVYFPDGSMARIDGGTTFTLKEGSYDANTGKSNTGFFLSVGRIWSKVVELATTDSSWEVETASAVATVRGTAFDSQSDGSDATFVGSENTVAVAPIDPATKKRDVAHEVLIAENKRIAIAKNRLQDVIAGAVKLNVVEHMENVAVDAWIARNKNQDARVNEVIQDLRQKFQGDLLDGQKIPPRLREQLKTNIRNRIRDYRIEHPEEFPNALSPTPILDVLRDVIKPPATDAPAPAPTPVPDAPMVEQPKPVSLVIKAPQMEAPGIVEGDRIQGVAILKFSDGSVRDVTNKVEWRVLGPIGHMEASGLFVAQLDPSVAEYGESSGTVIATFADSAINLTLLAKTPIFTVRAKIVDTPLDTGGQ